MTGNYDLNELLQRINRLEAEWAVRSTFNEYVYNTDSGNLEAMLDVFSEDAKWVLVNYPPAGSGSRIVRRGRDEISTWYAPTASTNIFGAGHYVANTAVSVAPDCSSADLNAYFHIPYFAEATGLLGGMYEARLVPHLERWQIVDFCVLVSWAWKPVGHETITYGLPLEEFAKRGMAPRFESRSRGSR